MIAAPSLVGRLSVAENRTVYLCELRNGSYVRLSQAAYDLLRSVEQGRSFDELAEIARRTRADVSPSDIEAAYRAVADKVATAEARAKPKRSGFWLTFTLLPARLVAWICRPIAYAYHPVATAVLVAFIAVGGWLAMSREIFADLLAPAGFGTGYLLFVASLVAHELGHASACLRYGVRPGGIGATMYMFYPALYTDVTAVWRLPRWQRVVVDLGGTYLQLVVSAGYVIAYLATGWPPLKVAVLLSAAACALSLNPILKFDGYWVIADALGVTNLGSVPSRLGAALWARVRGRHAAALPWSWPIVATLAVYSVATTVFWTYFLWLITTGISRLVHVYPDYVLAAWTPLTEGAVAGQAVFALVSVSFMMVFGVLVLWRVATTLIRLAASLRRRHSGA